MYVIRILIVFMSVMMTPCLLNAQGVASNVKIIGQMKDVMWKGELSGKINLDTISDKKHLYGLGPVEYLRGELLIMDGKAYRSTVVDSTSMKVEETFDVKAPFFGYDHIPFWIERRLPFMVQTMGHLEQYLDTTARFLTGPYFFKLSGTVSQATIHVVNLPEGATVRSPDEAHTGQVNYKLSNIPVEIVGFFSREHQAIFTHHDTFLHMHLITRDRSMMGHLDEVIFLPGTMSLFLPIKS
jgi:acetolactate decarboxylase